MDEDLLLDEPAEASKSKAMTDEALLSSIDAELENSFGASGDELSGNRSHALKYYHNMPRGDERTGRSQVQSHDVQDIVDATLADILPVFTGSYDVVWFPPLSPDGSIQARDETDYVKYQFLEENDGYIALYEACHDALLMRNGVLKVFIDEDVSVSEHEVAGIPPIQLLQLMSDPDVTISAYEETPGPDGASTVMNVQYLQKQRKRRLRVAAVDPDLFRVTKTHASASIEEAPFLCELTTISRGELLAEGVPDDVVASLPAVQSRDVTSGGADSDVQSKRDRGELVDFASNVLWTSELVELREAYMIVDFDGDNFAERRFVRCVAGHVLTNVITDYNPYISLVPFINPHRWDGISMYDKAKQTQDIKTSIWRNILDNLYQVTNNKFVVLRGQVELDDLMNKGPDGYIRARSPDAVRQLEVNGAGLQFGYHALDYADKARTENAGASLDSRRNQSNTPRDTAYGVERVVAARESLVGMIAKTIAEVGVKEMFRKIHRLCREHMQQDFQVLFRGRWMQGNPGEWRERTRVCVAPALSIGDMMRRKQALMDTSAQQQALLQAGYDGVLVDEKSLYNTQIEFGRVSGLESPEDHWVDPDSERANAARQAKAQASEQQAKAAEQQMQMMAQMQSMLEEIRARTSLLKADKELAFKREELYEDSANKLTEMALKYETDLPGDRVNERDD